MSPEKMVTMANQIATFFKTQPGTDQADRIAAHLRDFWDPGMRAELQSYVSKGGSGLDALVVDAARKI